MVTGTGWSGKARQQITIYELRFNHDILQTIQIKHKKIRLLHVEYLNLQALVSAAELFFNLALNDEVVNFRKANGVACAFLRHYLSFAAKDLRKRE